jgi:hypothetical protein
MKVLALLGLLALQGTSTPLISHPQTNEDCSNFNGEMGCASGSTTTYPADWANRSFQTYLEGDALYKPEYEGLGRVMCYPAIKYNSSRSSATVEMRCRTHSSVTNVQYNFGGKGFQAGNTFTADSSLSDALSIVVQATDSNGENFIQTLESLNFIWQA